MEKQKWYFHTTILMGGEVVKSFVKCSPQRAEFDSGNGCQYKEIIEINKTVIETLENLLEWAEK